MLSYRHGFHAGNHADVLKHVVLCRLPRALRRKERPFAYVDTHAGAGHHALAHAYAQQTREHESAPDGSGRGRPMPSLVQA